MFREFANKYIKVLAEYGESSENGLWLSDDQCCFWCRYQQFCRHGYPGDYVL